MADLTRLTNGCRLTYREDADEPVAWTLPTRREPYETTGDNLPPFFAGLLPEGRRLESIRTRYRIAADDLFALLVATGGNTIGDVSVSLDEHAPQNTDPIKISKFSDVNLSEIYQEILGERPESTSVAGVVEKFSASLSVPVVGRRPTQQHILKFEPAEYPGLLQNEHFFMEFARAGGFPTARTQLVEDAVGTRAILVERFDRTKLDKIHTEDLCQLLGRYPQDKYKISVREVVQLIKKVSAAPEADIVQFLAIYLFQHLIGNADFHAKNLSLWVRDSGWGIAPLYDVLSTWPYRKQLPVQRAVMKLDGKDDRFRWSDFEAFLAREVPNPMGSMQLLRRRLAKIFQSEAQLSVYPGVAEEFRHRLDSLNG